MIIIKRDVGVLCQYFYPEHVSSATLPTELALGLKERGLDIGVVCGYPQEYVDENTKKLDLDDNLSGVSIKRVKYTTFDNKSKVGRLFNFFSFFLSVLTKFLYLRNFKTIIVYSNPPILPLIPYLLKKIFGTKFIFVAFDVWPDNALKMNGIKENGVVHKVMDFINKRVYTTASNVILLGNEMKDYVINNEIATSKQNLKVIPNWFSNEENFKSAKIVNKEFRELKEQHKFIVLYSGNMGSFQDMETILNGVKSFANHDNIFFIFSGHGNKVEQVKSYIKDNEVNNAKVYGFLKGQDYSDVLAISDVCLVSLEKGIEGLGVPSKTYGYLAAGKPILSIMSHNTDIARDLAEFDCGINILQGDVNGFIEAINNYKGNPLLQKLEAINARKLYETKYTKDINVDKYYGLIKP